MKMKPSLTIAVLCLGLLVLVDCKEDDQPPIIDLLDTLILKLTPCAVPSLLKNITMTYSELQPCVKHTVDVVTDFFKKNSFNNYTDFYEKVLVNKGNKPSVFCQFFDDISSCFLKAFTRLCGDKIAGFLEVFGKGIRSYANCEGNLLPILQCVGHPDIIIPEKQEDGYMRCINDLVDEVNKKYLIDDRFYWNHFYKEAIVKNNGKGVQVLVTNFGTCLDTVVTKPPDCGIMRGHIYPHIKGLRDFMDYTNPDKGTDSLLCFANKDIHFAYINCEDRFEEDLVYSPPPLLPNTTMADIADYIISDKIKENWPTVLLWARNHFLSFSTCISTSTERHCDYKWSTQEVIRILHPTNEFFTKLRPEVKGPDCQGSPPVVPSSGNMLLASSTVFIMASGFLLR